MTEGIILFKRTIDYNCIIPYFPQLFISLTREKENPVIKDKEEFLFLSFCSN